MYQKITGKVEKKGNVGRDTFRYNQKLLFTDVQTNNKAAIVPTVLRLAGPKNDGFVLSCNATSDLFNDTLVFGKVRQEYISATGRSHELNVVFD